MLLEHVSQLKGAKFTAATQADYAYDWRVFTRWCQARGCVSLPASDETVAFFVVELLRQGRAVATVSRHGCGIAHYHRKSGFASPVDSELVRDVLRGARRTFPENRRQMKPLTVSQLRAASAACGDRDVSKLRARNRALVVFGFASALRRSSLSILNVDDLAFTDDGILVSVWHEKQDKTGEGRFVGVPYGTDPLTCPVTCIRAWLKHRGTETGPLFTRMDASCNEARGRLSKNAIWTIVKAAIAAGGLDPRGYGPHSLRAGLITEAGVKGVNHLVIANHSGHRSLESLRRYFRPTEAFRSNAAAMVGL